jgi:N-acetyl-alpha-D-glucosaminyl L-malate synthase BshA
VHTSNFRKVKRIEDIVLMFDKVRHLTPSKLLLVGDGPERTKIENMCRELDLMYCVRFLGNLDAIEEVLSVADLFVMPSETESFGLAALEAMACEVPLITSNAGGLPELNVQGVTGFMSNVGDVDDMVKNAVYILQDENLPRFKEKRFGQSQRI